MKVLGIPTKSLSSYTIQIAVAFFISGAFHASTLPPDIPDSSPLRYAYFFLIQGACVLIEVLAGRAMKVATGPGEKSNMLKTCLGILRVAWTGTVLYYTAPLIVDELVRVSRQMVNRPVFLLPVPKV
jgi:hydrogenase-4 membrane subunit HyfE